MPRDNLNNNTKNSLGFTLTLFDIPSHATTDILAALKGRLSQKTEEDSGEIINGHLVDIESQALEHIKDQVNELNWGNMLAAGIVRAMGYKTKVSPSGLDRDKDIATSLDGFGFEHLRIVAEVKHRKEQMSSQDILGGRHTDDRGLYVSIGGFTK
ncbi:restriction endonuclease [Paenalcaligenes suwonensis]|uniref:restriction endonuclease n=1 Tax=Paenalcaligenes suwonensis TaxID=1202713 RepID=UPI001F61A1A7|nr:restriction endonuclease [Paenalcaligenes suwonensis]